MMPIGYMPWYDCRSKLFHLMLGQNAVVTLYEITFHNPLELVECQSLFDCRSSGMMPVGNK